MEKTRPCREPEGRSRSARIRRGDTRFGFDPEDREDAPEPEERPAADREVEDLGVGERGAEPGEDVVVEPEVVEREALGELDRQSFTLGVAALVRVLDVGVQVIGGTPGAGRTGAKAPTEGAVVELSDP